MLIVTGIGIENAKKAALFVKEHFSPSLEDILLNIGIAAVSKEIPVGTLCKVGSVIYKDARIDLSEDGFLLQTVDTPQKTPRETLVDMEAYGLVEIFGTDLKVYKIISDHFEPENVTKEGVKKLVSAALAKLGADIERVLFGAHG